jgi:hypothetical protein
MIDKTITSDTIITAELLCGLDKCPFCGSDVLAESHSSAISFKCWTYLKCGLPADLNESAKCLTLQRDTLRARVQELEETNKTLYSLMVSGEKRGVDKATEEWSEKVQSLESQVQRLTEAGDDLQAYRLPDSQSLKQWIQAKQEAK